MSKAEAEVNEQLPIVSEKPRNAMTVTERQSLVWKQLNALIAERARTESEVHAKRAHNEAVTEQETKKAREALRQKFETQEAAAKKADEERRRFIVESALRDEELAKSDFARSSRRIAADFDSGKERARQEHQRDKQIVADKFDAAQKAEALALAKARKPFDDASRIIEAYEQRLAEVYNLNHHLGLTAAEVKSKGMRESQRADDPAESLFARLEKVEKPLKMLEGLFIPKAVRGLAVWPIFVIFLMALGPLVWGLDDWVMGGAIAGVVGLVGGFLARMQLRGLAKTQIQNLYYPLCQDVHDASAYGAHCVKQILEKNAAEITRIGNERDNGLLLAKAKHQKAVLATEATRDEKLRQINETYSQRMVDLRTKQQLDLAEAIENHNGKLKFLRESTEVSERAIDEKYIELKHKIVSKFESSYAQMTSRWKSGMTALGADLQAIRDIVTAQNKPWDPSDETTPTSAIPIPSVLRLGEITVSLPSLPHGVSDDPKLMEGVPSNFTFTAVREFPSKANFVVSAPAAGRAAAIETIQAAMLRLLTSLPAGAVKFTLIDPMGIGRNFGAFMHLADFDDSLINGQVWTEPRQIEERLTELVSHMEKVAQRFLRNDYATIEEYNAAAGEVAEPYKVLVIADFPHNFDEKAISRLQAIAKRGTQCGVLLLIAIDTDRPMPEGVSLADLAGHAEVLTWKTDRLVWQSDEFGALPLTLDQMPVGDAATKLIQRNAKAARDMRRVVVPFEFIAPARPDWWHGDTRAGIDIALGKSGPNKRQNLALGHGTSQHVLIAGRTGSGKSTLLHAIIANLALTYSPDEVELYLIDFKKGVEFKVYATNELPHAAVIAIESEREFGISVLQRLDAEMRIRGERFRDAGVQDINGYRNLPGSAPLPRVMLLVDEFQEFFIEEDKLAQEAATLLDRLVRQGRAFGVHVVLGSQTLGGAFTLARATLGQMAIRIALQCSESDANLILNEQNTAARSLSRPGEAVYNDANGMPEGNHFFQVVWLPDERREVYLKELTQMAHDTPPKLSRSLIVFEGEEPADLYRNTRLRQLVAAADWPDALKSSFGWLGDPVAIRESTAALFRRQGGSNLLILGQNEEMARGVLASTFISLANQYRPGTSPEIRSGVKFYLVDGTPEDEVGPESLDELVKGFPHPTDFGSSRSLVRILNEVFEDVVRRSRSEDADGPELFLFIHDIARFRELRKSEDDYGFSKSADDPMTPNEQLRYILREGPIVGVHLILWCDNLNNLNRILDHQGLKEIDMRVLFQMSQSDSGHLIDSPLAGKLGANRAIFASEEQNKLEKFRPYRYPSRDLLSEVRTRLANRVNA